MGQMQMPMQQAMYPQAMQGPPGYPMPGTQYPMGGPTPGAYMTAPAPMYPSQYQTGQPMDMNQVYQQQQQPQPQYGAKSAYATQPGMAMPQQIHQQHPQAQLGGNHFSGGGSVNNGSNMK